MQNSASGLSSDTPRCMHALAAHGLYVHSLPGRLRLELPPIIDNPLMVQKLELLGLRIVGVQKLTASAFTGRVLVEYDVAATGSARVVEALLELAGQVGCGQCRTAPEAPFRSPDSALDAALQHALKLGVRLTLGI